MNISDYDKIPCSAKEAMQHMRNGGLATNGYLFAKLSHGQLMYFSSEDSRWHCDCDAKENLLSQDWFKLVPKKKEYDPYLNIYRPTPKPDRFEKIDRVCDEIACCSDTRNIGPLSLELRKLSRAIVDLIEKEKA